VRLEQRGRCWPLLEKIELIRHNVIDDDKENREVEPFCSPPLLAADYRFCIDFEICFSNSVQRTRVLPYMEINWILHWIRYEYLLAIIFISKMDLSLLEPSIILAVTSNFQNHFCSCLPRWFSMNNLLIISLFSHFTTIVPTEGKPFFLAVFRFKFRNYLHSLISLLPTWMRSPYVKPIPATNASARRWYGPFGDVRQSKRPPAVEFIVEGIEIQEWKRDRFQGLNQVLSTPTFSSHHGYLQCPFFLGDSYPTQKTQWLLFTVQPAHKNDVYSRTCTGFVSLGIEPKTLWSG